MHEGRSFSECRGDGKGGNGALGACFLSVVEVSCLGVVILWWKVTSLISVEVEVDNFELVVGYFMRFVY